MVTFVRKLVTKNFRKSPPSGHTVTLPGMMILTIFKYKADLDDRIVGLQRRDIFLNLNLFFRMILNVIANLAAVVQVDVAHFGDVQTGGDDDVEALSQREEEEDGLDGDVADDRLKLCFDHHFVVVVGWCLISNFEM